MRRPRVRTAFSRQRVVYKNERWYCGGIASTALFSKNRRMDVNTSGDMKEAMETNFDEALQRHRALYPLMEPQDVCKLAYQSFLGVEHLLGDGFQDRLRTEWETVGDAPPQEPLDIGNGLCRFPLTGAFPTEAAAPLLTKLCLRTGAFKRDWAPPAFQDCLRRLEHADISGMGTYLEEYRRLGCPPVRHSRRYREAYDPHYRVIRSDDAQYFSALLHVSGFLQTDQPVIVAIDGPCGSGKSTLASLLAEVFPCNVFHMDDFYLPPSRRAGNWQESVGGNMDFRRIREELLEPAAQGNDILYRAYDCRTASLKPAVPYPHRSLTVLEGSYSLHPGLRRYYRSAIYVTCSEEERLRRLRQREGERFSAFQDCWIPLEERYFRACEPERAAALCIATGSLGTALPNDSKRRGTIL